jgi:urease accessory protein
LGRKLSQFRNERQQTLRPPTFSLSSPSNKRVWPALLMATLLSATATYAHAHSGTGLVGGVQSGLLHPLSGPDHMLAMVSVGLWGAILGRPLVVVLPVVFPAMMAIGGVLGILGVPVPPVEIGIAASVIILGGAIASAFKPPAVVAVLLVAIFALFHGYAHGQELPSAADPVGYSVGFVLATGALHLMGVGLGFVVLQRAGLKTLQAIGAGIALIGIWFLLQTNVFTYLTAQVP